MILLKISMLTAIGVGIGTWAKLRALDEQDCGCENTPSSGKVRKTFSAVGATAISPSQKDKEGPLEQVQSKIVNDLNTRKTPRLNKLAPSKATPSRATPSDATRWATKEGIIEMADARDTDRLVKKLRAVREGRIKLAGVPSNLKQLDRYIHDLEKWGTEEGLIEVSNDEQARKKKKKQLDRATWQGKEIARGFDRQKELKKGYEVTQVTVTNSSSEERAISLWQANKTSPVSTPLPEDVTDHVVLHDLKVPGAVHPQGVAVDPANGLTYIANQLSNNVSVVDGQGRLVRLVQLQPSAFPGLNSPVAVVVNTSPGSPGYGMVYVAGSVANTVSVINPDFEVVEVIAVGNRPLALAFNPVNEQLYVCNYADHTLSVIDTRTLEQQTLNTGQNPLGISVNPDTGEVYVVNHTDNSITVFDKDHRELTLIEGVGNRPSSIIYHPDTQEMWVISSGSDELVSVSTTDYQTGVPVRVGAHPNAIVFNPNNGFVYAACRDTDELTVIAPDKTIQTVLEMGPINNGLAVNPVSNLLFTTDTATGSIKIIGYHQQSGSITIDGEYEEKRVDFQYNPATVGRVRFIFSGNGAFNLLRIKEDKPTGSSVLKTISMADYHSPQHFQHTYEITGMKGLVIDGTNGWGFRIAPHQTITLLVWYRQTKRYDLLPETAPKSIGVEMSKGGINRFNNHKPIQ